MYKNKKILSVALSLGMVMSAGAEVVNVTTMRHAGPFGVKAPYQVDSLDVNSKNLKRRRFLTFRCLSDCLLTVKSGATRYYR